MIYGPVDSKMQELKYDCRNRLVKEEGVTYTYDAENTRSATTINGRTTEYVTDTGGSLSWLPVAYEPGGREGMTYFTDDIIEVKIINYQKMIGGKR